jgi:hypothetical protein
MAVGNLPGAGKDPRIVIGSDTCDKGGVGVSVGFGIGVMTGEVVDTTVAGSVVALVVALAKTVRLGDELDMVMVPMAVDVGVADGVDSKMAVEI